MSVSVTGLDDILKNIESKLGKNRATRVVNKALRETGKEVNEIVKEAVSSYIDTGETHETVVTSNVQNDPHKHVDTGWAEGPRWRLVHLNEFGYTIFGKYVRPRGMGKLQGAVDKVESIAMPKMHNGLEELAK